MGVKDITERLQRLRGRLATTASSIEATSAAAREAELAGRSPNGKLEELARLHFRRDTLAGEVERIERDDLPAAAEAEAAAESRRRLALARKIRANAVAAAGRADAALASLDAALADLDPLLAGVAREASAAGQRTRRLAWDAALHRAAFASAPDFAGRAGLSRALRTHALSLAAQVAALAPADPEQREKHDGDSKRAPVGAGPRESRDAPHAVRAQAQPDAGAAQAARRADVLRLELAELNRQRAASIAARDRRRAESAAAAKAEEKRP